MQSFLLVWPSSVLFEQVVRSRVQNKKHRAGIVIFGMLCYAGLAIEASINGNLDAGMQ